MNKLILIGFACVAIASCNGYTGKTVKDIDLQSVPSVNVVPEQIVLDKELLMPENIFAIKDGFVIYDKSSKDGIIHFFKGDGSCVCSFGRIGNASGEFLRPLAFQAGCNVIVSSVKGDYAELSYSDSLRVERCCINNKSVREGTNYMALTSDGVVLNSASSKERLVFVDKRGETTVYDTYPVRMPKHVDKFFYKNVIWESSYASSFDGRLLFAAQLHYPFVETINLEEKKEISSAECHKVSENEYKITDGIPEFDAPTLYYTRARASEKCFYALYHGVKEKDVLVSTPELHKFDKEGNLQKRIKLSSGVYSFAVNASDDIIYALAADSDGEMKVYKYDVSM